MARSRVLLALTLALLASLLVAWAAEPDPLDKILLWAVGGRVQVSPIPGLPGVQGGGGPVSPTTQRVAVAAPTSGAAYHLEVDGQERHVITAFAGGRRLVRLSLWSGSAVCCAPGRSTDGCDAGEVLGPAQPLVYPDYAGEITCRALPVGGVGVVSVVSW